MSKSKQMPKESCCFVFNKCPTKSVRDKMPKDTWSRRRPTIQHLKVIWCISYAHITY